MTSSRTKQFLVCYKNQSIELALTENATIDDLKFELFLKTNIHPYHQSIEGLPDDVQYDTTVDVLSNQRVLWLSNTDEQSIYNQSDSSDVQSTVSKIASSSFINHFICNYGDDYVTTLTDCSLSETLQNSCLAPTALRKLLALYLHNEHDLFSKTFCPTLAYGNIRNVLERSFHVVAWDLLSSNDGALEEVVDQWQQLEVIKSWITRKRAALFILHPYENSFAVYTALYGNTEINNIETVLIEIENCFRPEVEEKGQTQLVELQEKPDSAIGSQEFHQMMFDRLGDRDYDSFEADEFMYLKQKIGFAKFGPPLDTDYEKKQIKDIENTFDVIRKYSNQVSEWQDYVVVSFVYNCLEPLSDEKLKRQKKYPDYQPYSDIMPVPLFVIPKCTESLNPCRVFIDHENRVYSSWEKYKKNNNLHKCVMVLPINGRYSGNANGEVQLEKRESPSCSIDHRVLQGTDVVSSVAGIASGAVCVAAAIPAIAVAPVALTIATVTGIGVGAYGMIRSAVKIGDRAVHDQTMSFANSEARGAYLNIVAGSLGFVGAGATTAVAKLASKGANIGQGVKVAVNAITVANAGVSAASVINSSYEMFENLKDGGNVSTLSIIQLSSSILFFGNAIINFRSANTIIDEAQVNTLKNVQDSLKSNRLRKMFDKLLMETIRQGGNVQTGRAEVISTLSNFANKNEVMAILLRNNKLFNNKGIRFAAKNGKITLNGIAVDITELGTMSSSQKKQFLVSFSSIPTTATTAEMNTISRLFETVFTSNNARKLFKYGGMCLKSKSFLELATALLKEFSEPAKLQILKIFENLLNEFNILDIDFVSICKTYVPNWDPYLLFLKYVIQFIKEQANNNPQYPKSWVSGTNKTINFIEQFLNFFLSGGSVNRFLLEKLVQFVLTEITEAMVLYCNRYEKMQKRLRNLSKTKVRCSTCGGFTFAVV